MNRADLCQFFVYFVHLYLIREIGHDYFANDTKAFLNNYFEVLLSGLAIIKLLQLLSRNK